MLLHTPLVVPPVPRRSNLLPIVSLCSPSLNMFLTLLSYYSSLWIGKSISKWCINRIPVRSSRSWSLQLQSSFTEMCCWIPIFNRSWEWNLGMPRLFGGVSPPLLPRIVVVPASFVPGLPAAVSTHWDIRVTSPHNLSRVLWTHAPKWYHHLISISSFKITVPSFSCSVANFMLRVSNLEFQPRFTESLLFLRISRPISVVNTNCSVNWVWVHFHVISDTSNGRYRPPVNFLSPRILGVPFPIDSSKSFYFLITFNEISKKCLVHLRKNLKGNMYLLRNWASGLLLRLATSAISNLYIPTSCALDSIQRPEKLNASPRVELNSIF